jgi:hypothetical protein
MALMLFDVVRRTQVEDWQRSHYLLLQSVKKVKT